MLKAQLWYQQSSGVFSKENFFPVLISIGIYNILIVALIFPYAAKSNGAWPIPMFWPSSWDKTSCTTSEFFIGTSPLWRKIIQTITRVDCNFCHNLFVPISSLNILIRQIPYWFLAWIAFEIESLATSILDNFSPDPIWANLAIFTAQRQWRERIACLRLHILKCRTIFAVKGKPGTGFTSCCFDSRHWNQEATNCTLRVVCKPTIKFYYEPS